jgi:hypothetical protein
MFRVSKDGSHKFARTCDYNGPEMEVIEEVEITGKARAAACGKTCKQNGMCSHFTFNKTTSTCYLKKTIGFAESQTAKNSVCGYIPKRRQYKEELITVQAATQSSK